MSIAERLDWAAQLITAPRGKVHSLRSSAGARERTDCGWIAWHTWGQERAGTVREVTCRNCLRVWRGGLSESKEGD